MDSEVAQLRNALDQITTAFNAQPSASTTKLLVPFNFLFLEVMKAKTCMNL